MQKRKNQFQFDRKTEATPEPFSAPAPVPFAQFRSKKQEIYPPFVEEGPKGRQMGLSFQGSGLRLLTRTGEIADLRSTCRYIAIARQLNPAVANLYVPGVKKSGHS